MEKFIITIDQGTTSSRAILFNKKGELVAMSQRELKNYFPKPSWVEQDALEIWVSVSDVINELKIKTNFKPEQIEGIGITNQRETTIVWDKKSGQHVYNAIVWQSKQTQSICDSIGEYETIIRKKTGLRINPYFSASKIRFILDHIENGQNRAENGELMFGTVDTWLIYKLTKGKVFATDYSNASRTLLFNINELKWDEELCKIFNIPMCMLPEVHDSSYIYGYTTIISHDYVVPIAACAGDQQASLFGQNCFEKGDIKNTYGTGCFMLMNTKEEPVFSENGLLTTIAWGINGKVEYALEGSVFIGGASIQWLRDQLQLINSAAESETIAYSCNNDEEIIVVPAFVGLGTPYWDDNARGAIFGLTRGTTYKNLVKATLESIAYQSKDVIEVMKKESKNRINNLKVDGGATQNRYLMQFQADILGVDLKRPKVLETTALGVFYLAAIATGFYSDINEIKKVHKYQDKYKSQMDKETRKVKYNKWKKAVKATRLQNKRTN